MAGGAEEPLELVGGSAPAQTVPAVPARVPSTAPDPSAQNTSEELPPPEPFGAHPPVPSQMRVYFKRSPCVSCHLTLLEGGHHDHADYSKGTAA